ncbi:hypothetical protein Tco_1415318 [Tanacetum coccineum]
MLCYLAGMEPYYLKCIKDGLFQPKSAEGDAKTESQWTADERSVVVQDQCLKSIIMSCLPDDIMESVISCVSAKETWTDLVYSFEGPLDTKENRIMNLKLEYQTFRAKSTESLSQTYTHYKTLLNELANDGMEYQNHTQDLDLADIYERFLSMGLFLIQRVHSVKRKGSHYIKPSATAISTAFFSNNVIQDFQENSDEEDTFQPNNKGLVVETFDWDEEEVSDDEEVTQVKVLMALADDELTIGNSHARNGEWVEITIRKVNTLLSMDEEADWQNYRKCINIDLKFIEERRLNLFSKYNKIVFELNKCRDKLLVLKQANLDSVTFQIQNTELTKLQIPHQKKKVFGGELFTESSSKMNKNKNLFVPASMGYDQEMVPKTKDWVERLNPDNKLPNFNTGRILVPESQAVNESLEPTETLNTPESSKYSKAESLTSLPPLKNF